ncbi:MAG: radical SAM protein [Proteobacteria bacterium]|nr:radical SAM protein [Pseudomonadota bacterium]
MRILFINSNRFKIPWPVLPYGLFSVVASVEEAGHEVSFLDICFSKNPEKEITDQINAFSPDIIGIGIRNIDNCAGYNTVFLLDEIKKKVVEPCKRIFQGPIILGGSAVGINGKEILDYFDLSYAIHGDGEAAMNHFIDRIGKSQPLEGIKGLMIRESGKITYSGDPDFLPDLNTLPLPKPHKYIDLKNYNKYEGSFQLQTKRGCAFKCTYCSYKTLEGSEYRLKNPQLIADYVEQLVKETGINRFEFVDSTFNAPLDHAKEVLKAIINKNLDLNLTGMGISPASMDEELVDLMKRAGFKHVSFGIESGCEATLKTLGKSFTKNEIIKGGELIRNAGIDLDWYILVGAPNETYDTLKETLDFCERVANRWELVTIGIGIRVYKGAPLAKQLIRKQPDCTFDNFLTPVTYPPSLDLESLKAATKLYCIPRPNFLMYDEDTPPLILVKTIFAIIKKFMPGAPLWKFYIFSEYIYKWTGFSFARLVFYRLRKRKIFKTIQSRQTDQLLAQQS